MANHKNMFRSILDAMVESRAREASKYVNGALLMLDDESLHARGLSRAELLKGRQPFG
ncbi:MAG: hypothetical protein AAFY99_15845 [Pseudomonadota bacterium]